jgi:hypothetical protein
VIKVPINYDEEKVKVRNLPELFVTNQGLKIESKELWRSEKRDELLDVFASSIFGKAPTYSSELEFEAVREDSEWLNGRAIRSELKIYPLGKQNNAALTLLLYLPKQSDIPHSVFLGANFLGNDFVESDHERWPLELIINSGFGVATFFYGDIENDNPTGWIKGIRGEYLRLSGKQELLDDDWGAIAAWAWGLSRAMDYLCMNPRIDEKKVALIGHSRLGKAALWAAAADERFAAVISNNSGTGGAKLLRRNFGESIESITREFPHWFATNFEAYALDIDSLLVDSHCLLALVAPRPLYVASASDDLWADPRGEFLAAQLASTVYELFGYKGIDKELDFPPLNTVIGDVVGYHCRSGTHGITPYDWGRYIEFVQRHFGGSHGS